MIPGRAHSLMLVEPGNDLELLNESIIPQIKLRCIDEFQHRTCPARGASWRLVRDPSGPLEFDDDITMPTSGLDDLRSLLITI